MHRRSTTLSILAAGAVLSLTASLAGCGTTGSQPPAALPAAGGALGSSGGAGTATASGAAQIPADYVVDIQADPTGDPAKDGLLTRTHDMLMAYEQAVSRNAPKDSLYQSLTTSFARGNLYSMIDTFTRAGERPTGTVRFYGFSVRFTGKVADVFFCQDTSKVQPVSFKTGRKTGAVATGTAAYSWWDTAFEKDAHGAWAIVYVSSLVGRQSCM
ncbi:MAG TPA: hypothetical protein VGS97_16660 [Actinocrinis sp.]|uniref:hypothetical protein n=1 Tax=Actinocrinis sp. TaxID=1920516 RepID=UPI002DDD2A52|nr:hypothetical protein [Actinocrinis sp.]HEV2345733.1 hypothetical protein [Actinocrinis sp.]